MNGLVHGNMIDEFCLHASLDFPSARKKDHFAAVFPNWIRSFDRTVWPFASYASQADLTRREFKSVVTGDRMARTQTLGSTLGPRLRLGNLRQVHAHFLVGDAVEQMSDQI
jgi:hypothetical protein